MTPGDAGRAALVPPEVAKRIRLIASDLDRTLLTSAMTITRRARAAIQAAIDAGIVVVVATGRQVGSVPPEVYETRIDDILASNGAYGYRRSTDETLFACPLDAGTQAVVAAYLSECAPGLAFSAARNSGRTFACEQGYLDLMDDEDRSYERREREVATLAQVIAEPTLKLVARHPTITPDELLAMVEASQLAGFHATTSGAPFVELGAPGVTKATGLAQLAALHGIDQRDVLALGDAKNDVEMLAWAGWGVAMRDADPEALAVADAVTGTSDEDGFAQVIEELLARRA